MSKPHLSRLHLAAMLALPFAAATLGGATAQDAQTPAASPKTKPAAENQGTKGDAMTKKAPSKVKKSGAMSGAVEK